MLKIAMLACALFAAAVTPGFAKPAGPPDEKPTPAPSAPKDAVGPGTGKDVKPVLPSPGPGTISGTLRVQNCAVTAENVSVLVDGRSYPVTADDQGLAFAYTVPNMSPGPHTVRPNLGMTCPRGAWSPSDEQRFTLGGKDDGSGHDFTWLDRRVALTRTLSRDLVQTLASTAFDGMRLHLNDHDPLGACEDCYHAGQSFVQFNESDAPRTIELSDITHPWGTGNAHTYVNNINLTSTHFDYTGGKIRISLLLAGDGTEEIFNYQHGAIVPPPHIRLANMHIDIALTPQLDGGRTRLTYGNPEVTFHAELPSGFGDRLVYVHADVLAPQWREAAHEIEVQLAGLLNDPATRGRAADVMQSVLLTHGISGITSVTPTEAGITVGFLR